MANVPDRGDAIWIDFSPQSGHEQAGHRPVLIISPASYNGRIGLAIMCPITSRRKGYPFEVQIPDGHRVSGVVLADQVKSLDWRARGAEVIQHLPEEVTTEVLARLATLIRI